MSVLGSGTEDDRQRVLANQRRRWQYLRHLYDSLQDMPAGRLQSADGFEVARAVGIDDPKEADRVFMYLKEARLIKFIAMGPRVAITNAGIDVVERALAAPDQAAVPFMPINILNVTGGIHGSQIQQGVHSSTQSQSVDWAGLSSLIADIKRAAEQLSGDAAAIAQAHISTLEAQSRSPKPSMTILRESLASLRTVLEAIGGGVAANAITAWLSLNPLTTS